MEAIVKYLSENGATKRPYAVAKADLKPGDLGFNSDNEIVQVSQSSCVWHDMKVWGPINESVNVIDGEKIDIGFKCKNGINCGYPFCGSQCGGNEGFYVLGKESRY